MKIIHISILCLLLNRTTTKSFSIFNYTYSMSFQRSQIDLVKSDGRLLFVESKTVKQRSSQSDDLRPRVGYVFAVALILIGFWLLPQPILTAVSLLTILCMSVVAFVFLVQMPMRIILVDRYFKAGKERSVSPVENRSDAQS